MPPGMLSKTWRWTTESSCQLTSRGTIPETIVTTAKANPANKMIRCGFGVRI